MINYDRRRGGVEVRVQAGPKVASRLRVSGARQEDSGNYTCAAANTEAASVFVYVTEEVVVLSNGSAWSMVGGENEGGGDAWLRAVLVEEAGAWGIDTLPLRSSSFARIRACITCDIG
ncbi:hypothetical protein E2C01_034223 [Portunus trituberculatus]|uniref:Ig-like domain-containing protein n=1 Tax=Portunus trituberculatus TaxID=210409 RepID=A0A5B7F6E7_PORTR|nr:hypothetical protein [Portunus trituberculatus]